MTNVPCSYFPPPTTTQFDALVDTVRKILVSPDVEHGIAREFSMPDIERDTCIATAVRELRDDDTGAIRLGLQIIERDAGIFRDLAKT